MLKINNKGFTLVEMLAIIVILGLLAIIMVPTVTNLISKNKKDNYKNLENSIFNATKVLISDYRYDIKLDSSTCSGADDTRNISTIKLGDTDIVLTDSKLQIGTLVANGYLTTNSDGKILDPRNDNKSLNLNDSYVVVKYSCNIKDYDFMKFGCAGDDSCLVWQNN